MTSLVHDNAKPMILYLKHHYPEIIFKGSRTLSRISGISVPHELITDSQHYTVKVSEGFLHPAGS